MGTPVGARVGAILKLDAEQVHLLGFGVYDGDYEPPFGPLGLSRSEYLELVAGLAPESVLPQGEVLWTNPRITLDDGRVVWGCQCWWGPEDHIRSKMVGRQVVPAQLDD